ncbi:hypothetical protein [Pararhodonellum marinum]|uniref:hypothetical protein n=1 Tax=Pararhodonellum marinum TaxID=2755358 RepID=UPI00188E227F|nr:hypothetical protein [Pararhodonellum marinum]
MSQDIDQGIDPEENPQEDLGWLKHLQKNSWEPEVIMSGIILAFIFAFPSQVFDFSVRLMQDGGLNFLGAWLILIYLSSIINVFKIFLVAHLVLRFAWTGVLGLSYAFPHGVIKEKLFKISQNYEYAKPLDMVIRLEKVCSMSFAIPLMFAFAILPITLFLSLLLLIYKWFDLDFFTVYLIFLGSVLVLTFTMLLTKEAGWKKRFTKTIFGSIQAIYQSNLGKWATPLYVFFIFVVSIPLILADTKGFHMYSNTTNLSGDDLLWSDKSLYFESYLKDDQRFPRVLLSDDNTAQNEIRIFIAYYPLDEKTVRLLKSRYSVTLDTLGWHQVQEPIDLFRFYLNGSEVHVAKWEKSKMPFTNQRVFEGYLDLKGVSAGIQDLRIEKLMVLEKFLFLPEIPKLRENWAKFNFYKTKK